MTEQTPLSLFCSQTFSINTPMFLSTHCLLPYMRAFAQVADSKTCCLLHIMFVNDNTTVYVFILCHLWLSGCWMHLPPVDLSPEISPHFPYNHQNCYVYRCLVWRNHTDTSSYTSRCFFLLYFILKEDSSLCVIALLTMSPKYFLENDSNSWDRWSALSYTHGEKKLK